MRRREFLRATLASLPAATLLSGCANGDARDTQDGTEFFPQGVASGDPRSDSVVLWARVVDGDRKDEDLALELDVSRDQSFAEDVRTISVDAQSFYDGCAKVKLTDLEPGTTYYYRFIYPRDGVDWSSRVARTKTAPGPDDDVPIRFAYVSCQDYNGRYYTNYLAIVDEDLDFLVHLGDYVYETTGDPDFQKTGSDRRVVFGDEGGAIVFNEGTDEEYFAAKSLDNYRDLYRIYRSDEALQRVHERFPMIVIWDDHEFADDSHGATATHFGGREDETDPQRRQNANQAWFEYMPVDFGEDDFEYDPGIEWPDDIRIYRSFQFGKHLELVMTDARTWRTDHLIPEGAFPGTVAVDEDTLIAELGEVPDFAEPYVDIESYDGGSYAMGLIDAASMLDYDPAHVTGNISVRTINEIIEESGVPLLPIEDTDALPRGLAYVDMGKTTYYGRMGARNLVVKPTYDAYGQIRWQQSGGESEHVLGAEQEAWFFDTVESSDRTWKVWGNEYALSQVAVDLSGFAIPDEFKKVWYLSVDLWDGHRNRRSAMIERLAQTPNVVAITGDIHGFHAGTPMVNGDLDTKIIEFVGSSISSATFEEELNSVVDQNPALADFEAAKQLVELADFLINSPDHKINPHLPWSDSTMHGYVMVEVSADELVASFRRLSPEYVAEDYSDRPEDLASAYSTQRFKVVAGESELYKNESGEWVRWNPHAFEWE